MTNSGTMKATKPTKTRSASRNRWTISLATVSLFAVLMPGAFSAPGTLLPSDTITLERCIEIARQRSPELQMASDAIVKSRLEREITEKNRWPQMRLSGNAGYAPFSHTFGYDPAVSNGGELGANLVIEQTLYSGGLTSVQLQQATGEIARSALARQQQDRDLVYSVRQACIKLLLAEQIQDLLQGSIGRLGEYAKLVTDMNKAGTAGYTDVLNSQVELDRARIEANASTQDSRRAKFELLRLLGMPDDSNVVLTGKLETLLIDASDSSAINFRNTITDNLDLSSAKLDHDQKQLALSATRARWKPVISLTADAGVVTSRENLLLPAPERYRSVGYSLGMSIDWPLWNAGRRKTELAKDRSEVSAAKSNIDRVQRDFLSDYRDTRLGLINTSGRLRSIRQVSQTAEKSYLLSTAQYADGYASMADVLMAQQALTDTRRSEIETMAQIQLLKAWLDKLTWPKKDTLP